MRPPVGIDDFKFEMERPKMIKQIFALLIVFAFCASVAPNANAHDVFQDVLKEVYTLKSFSCKTCHQDSDNRKLRTPFAERIYQEMKTKKFSEAFDVASKADAETEKTKKLGKGEGKVAELEKVMAVEFKEAFKRVAVQKMTFDEMIKQGLFNGARLDTKKLKAMKEENINTESETKKIVADVKKEVAEAKKAASTNSKR